MYTTCTCTPMAMPHSCAGCHTQAYGIVWKSIDRRTGEIVALKKIFDAFTNATDAQRTYREIMFLQVSKTYMHNLQLIHSYSTHDATISHDHINSQEFSSHENVIQLLNVIRARNDQDIYLVFEFMDTDLHAVVKAKILQPVHIQYIMYQVSITDNTKTVNR